MTRPRPLTALQQRFVTEYLKDFNATGAHHRAGYACAKPYRSATRTLNAPPVRAAIEAAQSQAVHDATVDAARVVGRYAAIAFASVADFVAVAPDGTPHADIAAIDPERLVALQTIDVTERRLSARAGGGRIRRLRIRLACKLDALDALARHLGLFDGDRPAVVPPEPEPIAPLPAGVGPSAVRRARFVAEFLRCNNATHAYVRAGYKRTAAARFNASRLRADPGVRAAIEAGRRRLARRFAISVERVLEEYARIAFASMNDYLDIRDDGTARLDLRHARPENIAALREIVVEQHIDRPDGLAPVMRGARLKLASKQRALDVLARYLGLFRKPDPLEDFAEDFRLARERVDVSVHPTRRPRP